MLPLFASELDHDAQHDHNQSYHRIEAYGLFEQQ